MMNKKYAFLAGLLFLAIVLPVSILFLQKPQDNRQHASGKNCNNTGVTKNNDGSYSFATLTVDSNGTVVDANNPSCVIHLLGLNQGWLTSDAPGGPPDAELAWFTQQIQYNIVRVPFNGRWWIDNVPVPLSVKNTQKIPYQTFLADYVTRAQNHGLYVELDLDTQFPDLPCAPDDPNPKLDCPSPKQGQIDFTTQGNVHFNDPSVLSTYQPTALQALTSIVTTYKNNPGVLFDVWNEPGTSTSKVPLNLQKNPGILTDITETDFFKYMQDRVTTVANLTSHNLIIVYERALIDMMPPTNYSPFSQKNIMFDEHNYDTKKKWQPSKTQPKVDFAHKLGQAYVIGEWGGSPEQPSTQLMGQLLQPNNVNSTYYNASVSFKANKGSFTITQIGQDINTLYTTLFGNPLPTVSLTPPVATTTPTPIYKKTAVVSPTLPQCNHSGRIKNPDGSFTFSPLTLNSHGILVDPSGCEVYLVGGQGKQPQPTGSGEYSITRSLDFPYMDTYLQNVTMNLLRVPIIVDDWNNNVVMTDEGNNVLFQDFVKSYFKAIESRGMYVEIDKYGSKTNPQDDVTALTSMAKAFNNDPAVIFDVRNEGAYGYEQSSVNPPQMIYTDDVSWLNAVDAGNPGAIKVLYMLDMKHIQNHEIGFTFYTNKNLIIDWHLYSGFIGPPPGLLSPDTNTKCNEPNRDVKTKQPTYPVDLADGSWVVQMIQFARSQPNPASFIFNEWGGCESDQAYVSAMQDFTLKYNTAGLSYFYPSNWFKQSNPKNPVNGNGTRTNVAYQTILGAGPTPSPTATISTTPTPTLTGIITPTPSLTITPPPGGTGLALTIGLHGVGMGDNVNPQGTGNITTDPTIIPQHSAPNHPQRPVTLTVSDLQGQNPVSLTGQIVFNNGNPVPPGSQGPIYFLGTIPADSLSTGNYLVKVITPDYLQNAYSQVIHVTQGQVSVLPPLVLVNGNIVNSGTSQNQIDLLDYNALINCFGPKQQDPSSCTNPPTNDSPGADINDDGIVDGGDYNLFVRELSVQQGQ